MKNKKQIIFYCPGLYPCTFGGLEIYNNNLVKQILQRFPDSNWIVLTSCSNLIDNKNYLSLKNKLFISSRYGLGELSTIFYYALTAKIKWRHVETIYIPYTSNFSYNAIAFLLLKFIFNIKYVIHIHGGGMRQWNPYWLQKIFFKKADKIAGVSWPIVNEYSKRSNRSVKYLPPLLPFKKAIKNKQELKKEKNFEHFDKIILFVGSLKPLKAPDIVVKAFNEIDKELISLQKIGLVIVGDGEMRTYLKTFVKQQELEDHVYFTGKIPNESIADYYALSDYYVISSWFEGTPISLLEAMHNELVCIGSDVSGINSILEDQKNGLLFEKNNYNELKMKIENILREKIDIKRMVKQMVKDYHKDYDYSRHIDQIYHFIRN